MNIRDRLVSQDSILETRTSSDSNFETWGVSLEDRTETVNLHLSSTVRFVWVVTYTYGNWEISSNTCILFCNGMFSVSVSSWVNTKWLHCECYYWMRQQQCGKFLVLYFFGTKVAWFRIWSSLFQVKFYKDTSRLLMILILNGVVLINVNCNCIYRSFSVFTSDNGDYCHSLYAQILCNEDGNDELWTPETMLNG